MGIQFSPLPWSGRDDGPGTRHRRWHHAVNESLGAPAVPGIALIGFRSDEGVRRNRGRVGSAAGPAALRDALASLSAGADLAVVDFGDAGVTGTDLESGQQVLGDAVSGALDSGHLPIVLGGGHETAFGSYLGLRASAGMTNTRLGIVNLDAHFDLRSDTEPSSGTPFRQIAEAEATAGHDFTYRVIGVSEPNNTLDLFETAAELGVAYLLDEECGPENLEHVSAFVADLIEDVDAIYLTIDLDVLPAYVAPGVSAPAAHGVPFDVILSVCKQLARSPKLAHVDVVELNPGFDIDNRTARAAARLIHTIAAEHTTVRRKHRADSDSSTRSSN